MSEKGQAPPPRVCFLAERQVGIGSAAGALEPYVRAHANVTWLDVTYRKDGGFIERLPFPGRVGGTLRGYLQTGAALRRGPFDALFFLTHNPAVLRQSAVRRTPTLLWTDVTPALLDEQADQYAHTVDKSTLARSLKHALVRRTFRSAAFCVGWSEWARRSFIKDYGVREDCTAVVAPGLDLARWSMPERRVEVGLPRLLFVGGDFQRKGGDLLLAVFREHFRGRCELDLVTRDPVPEEAGVRVHRGLTANSDALLALYQAARAFVLPTRGDCYSIASLEAMARGLPVIVTNVGGIADIVETNVTGLLVEANDGSALRTALDALLTKPERCVEMGRLGRRRIEQHFDASKTAHALMALLGEMIARKRLNEQM
ncbi:MAG TPA: glycosyltransferase family 4 protein [Polyangiaceae bacterium]